jgi:hypothetical protein
MIIQSVTKSQDYFLSEYAERSRPDRLTRAHRHGAEPESLENGCRYANQAGLILPAGT